MTALRAVNWQRSREMLRVLINADGLRLPRSYAVPQNHEITLPDTA